MQQLLIATRNNGKLPEIKTVLDGLPIEVVGLSDVPGIAPDDDVEEPAVTFEGNAIIKALMWGEKAGMLTLADDSGLVIDTLDGWPGVKTARAAPTEEARNELFLEKLQGVPQEERTARLVSVAAIYDPALKKIRTAQGIAEGYITESPQGTNGFGVDPIFFYNEAGEIGGNLSLETKTKVSHRGKAMQKAREILVQEFLRG